MRERQNHKYISKHTSKSGKTVYVYDRKTSNNKSTTSGKINYLKKNIPVLKRVALKVLVGYMRRNYYGKLNPISNTEKKTKMIVNSGRNLVSKVDMSMPITKVVRR